MRAMFFENSTFDRYQRDLVIWLEGIEDIKIMTISQVYVPGNISETGRILTTIIYEYE
jgi:hypothetical protein